MKAKRIPWAFILGCAIGAATFIYLYGTAVLNPTYDDWIFISGSDITQHYQGWQFYRKSAWSFPIGLFDGLSYPLKASIIFFDSIPLFAVLFKILSPILPETFQYFGWWGLLCYCLQGGLAAKILEKYLKSLPAVCLGTVCFTSVTVLFLWMFSHTSLTSHWIILLCFLPLVYYGEYFCDLKHAVIFWGIAGILCSSVHLYFLPMCGIILLGFLLKDFLERRDWKRAAAVLGSFLLCAALTVALLGGFYGGASAAGNGLGIYSFNLNGFYNSRGRGRYFPALPYTGGGQLEGYAYLGAGVLLMLPVSAGLWLFCSRKSLKEKAGWKKAVISAAPWILILILSIGAAVSPMITLNDRILFSLPLPSIIFRLWSVFRASGRLVWPAMYVLMLFALCAGLYHRKKILLYTVLGLCVLIQVRDAEAYFREKRNDQSKLVYENPLDGEVWKEIAEKEKTKHLVIQEIYSLHPREMYQLAEFAERNDMDQNYFHYAHSLGSAPWYTLQETMKNLSDDAMYIFEPSEAIRCGQYDLHYYEANGHIVGLTWKLERSAELDAEGLGTLSWGFLDNRNLSNGEDVEGIRYVHPLGISFGPYISMPAGDWEVTVYGENLENGTYSCTYDGGNCEISDSQVKIAEGKATIRFTLPQDVGKFEVVVRNNGEEDMLLTQMTIRKASNDQ